MKKIIKISLSVLSIIAVHSNIQSDATNNNQSQVVTTTDQENTNQEKKHTIQDQFQAKKNILNNRKRQTEPVVKREVSPEISDIYKDNPVDEPFEYVVEKYPLFSAVKKNDLRKVQELLKQKVDINLRDSKGKTAYDYAVEKSKNWMILPSQRGLAQKISELIDPYKNADGSMKEID